MSEDVSESLPFGLQAALRKLGWKVTYAQRIDGVFAGTLIRLRLQTQTGQELETVYKRFAPGRARELRLYSRFLQELEGYGPKLLVSVQSEEEQGILLENAGRPLKALLRQVSGTRQASLLQGTAACLAALHTQYEEQSRQWLARGWLGVYPVDSARTWASEAVGQILWLQEKRLGHLPPSATSLIQTVMERVYPQFPKWLAGRTTLTHGDPHLENVLFRGLDAADTTQMPEMRLIDWEYACVTVPQRDLSIFVQDILDPTLHEMVVGSYWNFMREAGWRVDEPEFKSAYLACLLDNTLMMLGWDIHKFREHYLGQAELEEIITVKLGWMQRALDELFG